MPPRTSLPAPDATLPLLLPDAAAPPEEPALSESGDNADDSAPEAGPPETELGEQAPASTEPAPEEPPAPEPRRLTRAERDTIDRQRGRFAACGRCGYFIADCQIYLGQEALREAILASRDGWLRLQGDATFHKLAKNAFGIQLDVDFDSFDGTCPECRRRFVIVNTTSGPTHLKIRL